MAAQGNETSYQRAEGESSQWEDIQRKLGNFTPKAKMEVDILSALGHATFTLFHHGWHTAVCVPLFQGITRLNPKPYNPIL